MTTAKIRAALESRLSNMPGGTPIAWENTNVAAQNAAYLSSDILFAEPDDSGFKNSPFIQRGLMQITLHFPTNVGPGPADTKAEQIRAWFNRGTSPIIDGFAVNIERTPEITGGGNEAGKYVKRVRIRFYAEIDPQAA